jgi:hypothetical protein
MVIVGSIIANLIAILVIALILGVSIFYIVKSKKKGVRCIGCPSAGSCAKYCGAKPKKTKQKK